jgi:hypothetical protein
MLSAMTLHRPRRPYSPAYARRQLARVQAQIAAWRDTDCAGDWRKSADKARALASLECQQARWLAVLSPPELERFVF